MKLSIITLTFLASQATAFAPIYSPQPYSHTISHTSTKPSVSSLAVSTSFSVDEDNNDIDLIQEANAIFDSIDVNQDGSISEAECRTHMMDTMGCSEDSAAHLFALMDIDVNGEISRKEMTYAFQNYGAINLYMTLGLGGTEVMTGAYSERIKRITKKNNNNNNSDDQDSSSSKLLLDDLADLVFDLIDTDQSDKIDQDELRDHFDRVTKQAITNKQAREYVETIFSVIDINDDKFISREEMRAAFKQYDFRFLCNTLGLPVYKKRNSV